MASPLGWAAHGADPADPAQRIDGHRGAGGAVPRRHGGRRWEGGDLGGGEGRDLMILEDILGCIYIYTHIKGIL